MAKIILIDDDPVLLKLYSTKLTSDGHQLETATDGEQGLELVKQFEPHIIILDLLMPKLNGFKFIQKLQQIPTAQNTPIIVFSSVANQEQIERLKQLGIDTYLNKIDVTPTQLVEVINQKLGVPPPSSDPGQSPPSSS